MNPVIYTLNGVPPGVRNYTIKRFRVVARGIHTAPDGDTRSLWLIHDSGTIQIDRDIAHRDEVILGFQVTSHRWISLLASAIESLT